MALPGSDMWIVSTSLDKPDHETRRFIRSHVMRGKNTRATKRSRRLAVSKSGDGHAERPSPAEDANWSLTTPRKLASEISLFGLEIELKSYMLDLMHRAFTFIKPSQTSVETTLIGLHQQDFFCFSDIARSPAMIHSMIFTAQVFNDMLTQTPEMYGHVARYHLSQALHLLQESLNDEATAIEISTMTVVASLATAGIILGDLESARKHLDGLYKMVQLAGGLESLGSGTMIEHKALRIDFGLAMADGRRVMFFRDDVSWGPHPSLGGRKASRFPELSPVQPRPEPRLLNIWADLRGFSAAANQATKFGIKMPSTLFADVTSSAPYRLTNLELEPASLHELLRLCMLAFLKNILTNIPGLGRNMTYLATETKCALLAQRHTHAPELDELIFWSLFIAALAIFEDFDRGWIREMMQQEAESLELQSWTDARAVLKKFLWVDLVFDRVAETLFNEWLGAKGSSVDGRSVSGASGTLVGRQASPSSRTASQPAW